MVVGVLDVADCVVRRTHTVWYDSSIVRAHVNLAHTQRDTVE